MSSIVAPAIEAEISYRYERATEEFRRARSHRRSRSRRKARPAPSTRRTAAIHHA